MLGCYAPVRPGRGRQYRDGGADAAFDELAEKWGPRYPAVVRLWDNGLGRVHSVPPQRSPSQNRLTRSVGGAWAML
jgi:transposase-like protein